MLFLQKLELRHSCRGGKQGARRVRRANREQKLWVQKIIKPVYLELRERRPKCRRQKGMVSPLQHPGMFINDARRHVCMIVILTAVRIRAALKQHMRVWQRFLFNAFVLWWFFLTRKSIPYQLPTKLKRWCLVFSMPAWRGQRKFMVENTIKHSSSCLMYPEVEGVQAAHERPCIKLQAFRGWSAFSGLWLKFYTLQAQTFPYLLGCFNLHTLQERILPLDPSKIFMVFLMCPKVIIGTKDIQKEKMIWFTYSVSPGPKAFNWLLSLELLLSCKKVSHVKGTVLVLSHQDLGKLGCILRRVT